MYDIGHLGRQAQIRNLDRLENDERPTSRIVGNADLDIKPKYTIDEILDKVEEGDISILVELGISYTEITTEAGDKKISFKYEGIRYTVNVINNINETKVTATNTRRQNFDDGSYSIYETDENGLDLKRTDYNADGSVQSILEYTYNNDGTVVYTYKTADYTQITNLDKNGNVVHNTWYNKDGSLRETAEYTRDNNGVETTITKDANGKIRDKYVYDWNNNRKIAKETYDANGELVQYDKYEYADDGTLVDTTYDANDKVITIAKYNSDGSLNNIEYYGGTKNIIEETNFYYDNKEQRLEITEDAQNNILVFRQFDKKGRQIFNFDPNNYNLQDLKKMKNILENQLNDISIKISSLDVPTPPNVLDYKKSGDGSIDENTFNKAMQEYQEQVITYNNQIDELNKKFTEIQNTLQQVNKQITELELKTKIENIENTINSLKNVSNNELISLLEITLENLKHNLSNLSNRKLELQSKIQSIYSQILSIQVPTPPSANDYKKPDGSVDEKAYETAFKNYENQKNEYNKRIQKLEAEISVLYNEEAKIDMELQKQTNELNQLEKNANAVKTIQDLINGIKNEENHRDLVSNLNAMLESLYENIRTQNDIRKEMDRLQDSLMNKNIPTPPSGHDYRKPDGSIDEEGYAKAFEEYEKAKNEYDKKIKQLNQTSQKLSNDLNVMTNYIDVTVFNSTVMAVEEKISQLIKNGNHRESIKLEIRLNRLKNVFNTVQKQREVLLTRQTSLLNRLNNMNMPELPNTNDYILEDGSFDEHVYEQALSRYESQKNKYDRLVNMIHNLLDSISEKLNALDDKVEEVQSEMVGLVRAVN